VGAQIDDSRIKYQKVHWYIVYPETKTLTSDALQTVLVNDKKLYEFKSEDPITQDKRIDEPIQMFGTLTFIESTDAQAYYTKIITTVKGADVIYAKIDLTSNSHHWSDDRVQPDIILGQTILGDSNAIPFP
jgi:hypothetical protein